MPGMMLPLLLLCLLQPGLSAPEAGTSLPESPEAAHPDLISNLPGLVGPVSYKQYSGYLQADEDTYFHYWFVESEKSPSEDPLLLWLNGGPGCSSMDGLLNELGPFTLSEDGSRLLPNPYAWNTFANVLFIESPACVGYSYNLKGNCSASDDGTSLLNYNALLYFFEKFPQFKKNKFFVTGESYGGIYVPTLTLRIAEARQSNGIQLQGFAVGNGLSSFEMNDDSIIFFAYFHGLLDQDTWDDMVHSCCDGDVPSRATCHFSKPGWGRCTALVRRAMKIVYESGLNMYNLYADCINSDNTTQFTRHHAEASNMFRNLRWLDLGGKKMQLGLDPPCTSSAAMRRFMNDKHVKEAIHVAIDVPWEVCNDEVNFHFKRQYASMRQHYAALLGLGLRALVYNGDVDMACNYLGDQWFVEALGLKTLEQRRMWHSGGQVGGFVKRFEGLDLLTVRGSGHMVPQDRPGPALDMIRAFVEGTPY